MWLETLAVARDISVILLALEFLLLGAIPLIVLYYITRGLRQLLPKVVPTMRQVRDALFSVFEGIEQVLATIRAPFICMVSMAAGVRAVWASLTAALTDVRRALFQGR